MTKTNKQKCREHLNKIMAQKDWNSTFKDPTKTPWVILIDGKRATLSSKKSLWKQLNHAKCAILHEMKVNAHPGYPISREIDWFKYNDEVAREWITEHVEYITLDEWKKRGCP